MSVCLSPCGGLTYQDSAPARRLVIGTVDGIRVLERDGVGKPWAVAADGLRGQHVACVSRDPKTGILAAGCHSGGLYISEDDGATWTARHAGLRLEHIFTVAFVPDADRPVLYAGSLPVSLFRSSDLGRTWEELPAISTMPGYEDWYFPGVPSTSHVKVIHFDPRDSKTMYVGVEQGALLKSTDGGKSWVELAGYSRPDDPYHQDIHQIVLVPSNPNAFYVTTGIGIYYSPDGGTSWDRLTDPSFRIGYPDHLVISPLDNHDVFVAGAKLEPSHFRTGHYADGAIMRSRDAGKSWERVSAGLPPTTRANMAAMSISSYPGGFSLFVADTDGFIYVSDDGGANWLRMPDALPPVSKVLQYTQLREKLSA